MVNINELEKRKPYRITRGNDSLSKDDIIWISDMGGLSLVICPKVSDCKGEQGGWYDEEDLSEHPKILDFEFVEENDYEVKTIFGGEGLERVVR